MIDLSQIFVDTLSGIIVKLPEFILILWGIKTISKNMPKWISEYERIKIHQRTIDRALGNKDLNR